MNLEDRKEVKENFGIRKDFKVVGENSLKPRVDLEKLEDLTKKNVQNSFEPIYEIIKIKNLKDGKVNKVSVEKVFDLIEPDENVFYLIF